MANVVPISPVAGSTNIAAHGYDGSSQTLAVQYHNGATWHYANVDSETADRFATADSLGSFLAREIKPNFEGVRVDNPDAVA